MLYLETCNLNSCNVLSFLSRLRKKISIIFPVLDMDFNVWNCRRFLMGLVKYGKGDWRNIARNFVVTKTPTQVASHAQKYFIRQLSGVKEKRRPSIHDITIVNLTESATSENKPLVFSESHMLPSQQNSASTPKVQVKWNEHEVFDPNCDNLFLSSSSEFATKALKLQGQDLYDRAFHGAYADLKEEVFMSAPRDFNKAADFGIHAN